MFPSCIHTVTRAKLSVYVTMRQLIDACNKTAYTLRVDHHGLDAFLIEKTAQVLQADTEITKQYLTPKERDRLPYLADLDDHEMVTIVRLYAQRAADRAFNNAHFDSLSEYPTGND